MTFESKLFSAVEILCVQKSVQALLYIRGPIMGQYEGQLDNFLRILFSLLSCIHFFAHHDLINKWQRYIFRLIWSSWDRSSKFSSQSPKPLGHAVPECRAVPENRARKLIPSNSLVIVVRNKKKKKNSVIEPCSLETKNYQLNICFSHFNKKKKFCSCRINSCWKLVILLAVRYLCLMVREPVEGIDKGTLKKKGVTWHN